MGPVTEADVAKVRMSTEKPDPRGTTMRRWCYQPKEQDVEGPASERFKSLVTCGDGTQFLKQRQGGLRRTDLLRVPGTTRSERKANLKAMAKAKAFAPASA